MYSNRFSLITSIFFLILVCYQPRTESTAQIVSPIVDSNINVVDTTPLDSLKVKKDLIQKEISRGERLTDLVQDQQNTMINQVKEINELVSRLRKDTTIESVTIIADTIVIKPRKRGFIRRLFNRD